MNNTPAFVTLNSIEEYKQYYIDKYCKNPIITFDGIKVKFYNDQFEHSFYESSNHIERNKDVFSWERAKRIDWIEYVLTNPYAEVHVGWDRDKKTYSKDRRVAIITPENYVVIIRLNNNGTAKYITSYLADTPRSAREILNSPMWNA